MPSTEALESELVDLVAQYRTRCLWFLRPDYHPETVEQKLRTLDSIRRYGDRDAFVRASRLRQWLLTHSNEESVAS
jgi:hypothetical protein